MESKDIATTTEGQDMFKLLLSNLEKMTSQVTELFLEQTEIRAENLGIQQQLLEILSERKDPDKVTPNDSLHSENYGFAQEKAPAAKAAEAKIDKKDFFKTKRKTIFNPTAPENPAPVVIMKTTNSYAHIKLTNFNRDHVIKFMTDYNKWVQVNGTTFPIYDVMSNPVVYQIVANNVSLNLSPDNIHTVSNESLIDMVRIIAQPKTVTHFIDALKAPISSDVHFKDDQLNADNFHLLYRQLLYLRMTFLQRFEFSAEQNEAYIPHVQNKPGGLIHIFLSHADAYGNYVRVRFQAIKPEELKKFNTAKDFYAFLDLLYEIFKTDFDKSIEARELKLALTGNRHSDDKHSKLFAADSRVNSGDRKPSAEFDDDDRDDSLFGDAFGYKHSPDLNAFNGAKPSPTTIMQRKQDFHTHKPAATNPPGNVTNGCFRKLKHNRCEDANCKYSHKWDDMHKLWAQESQALAKSPFKSSEKPTSHNNLEANTSDNSDKLEEAEDEFKKDDLKKGDY